MFHIRLLQRKQNDSRFHTVAVVDDWYHIMCVHYVRTFCIMVLVSALVVIEMIIKLLFYS